MVGHGLDYEVVAPFFSLRLHPYTSLRGSACVCAQVAQAQGPDTDCFLRPPRRRPTVSISCDAWPLGQVQVAHQTGWTSRGPLLCRGKKGRCNHQESAVFVILFSKLLARGYWMVCLSACAEDRALLGSNPSADTGPEAGGEYVTDGSPRFFCGFVDSVILLQAQSDKSRGSGGRAPTASPLSACLTNQLRTPFSMLPVRQSHRLVCI